MKKVILTISFVFFTSTVNAGYSWEYWTSGNFGGKTMHIDEAIEVTGGQGNDLTLLSNSMAVIEKTNSVGINEIVIDGDSLLYLSGGTIGMISSFQNPRQSHPDSPPVGPEHIFITCREFNYNETTEILSGTWEDWSAFDIKLNSYSAFPAIDNIDITIVPEPATLFLFGLGAIAFRNKS